MKPEKPITRKEMYLDVATGGSTELPSPVTREEKYLAKIAGESVDIPTPVTRYEMLLAAVAGESYTPTPVTRLEIYLAKAAGQDVEIPQPVTREEMYWFDYCGGTPTPPEREYTGAVPVTFAADGTPLLDYIISGNTVQSGTPTPDNPIMPEGCGELEAVGAKAGQYKIPISSANTTTPVYLGEVETTRKIKKLVLTGEENIPNNDGASYNSNTSTDRFVRDIPYSVENNGTAEMLMCTHLGFRAQSWAAQTKTGCCIYQARNTIQLHLRFDNTTLGITQSDTNEQRTAKLKSYLAQQYAAGTPVCVWYVLANPETAVVNEPLMRISDYVDTLSMEQAGVQIPTANGSTTLDVDTTVKPSEIYIKYRGEAVATLSMLSAEVSSPEATEEVNPEETEEEENGSEDISLQHEFEAIE